MLRALYRHFFCSLTLICAYTDSAFTLRLESIVPSRDDSAQSYVMAGIHSFLQYCGKHYTMNHSRLLHI
jgi:hypothetical protein